MQLQLIDDDVLIAQDIEIYHALKHANLAKLGRPALENILRRLDLVDIIDQLDHKQALDMYQMAWLFKFSDDDTREIIKSTIQNEASTI